MNQLVSSTSYALQQPSSAMGCLRWTILPSSILSTCHLSEEESSKRADEMTVQFYIYQRRSLNLTSPTLTLPSSSPSHRSFSPHPYPLLAHALTLTLTALSYAATPKLTVTVAISSSNSPPPQSFDVQRTAKPEKPGAF